MGNNEQDKIISPATHSLMFERITFNQLSGNLIKQVDIAKGYVGLVVQDGTTVKKTVKAGHRTVVSMMDILLKVPANIEVVRIRTAPVTVPLLVQNMLDADNTDIGLWAQVELEITDPASFFKNLHYQGDILTADELLIRLLTEIKPGLNTALRKLSIADKTKLTAVEKSLEQTVHELFSDAIKTYGIQLHAIKHLSLWSQNDAMLRVENIQKFKQALTQVKLDNTIDRVEQFAVMHDMLTQMADDYNLPPEILSNIFEEITDLTMSPDQTMDAYAEALESLGKTDLQSRLYQIQHPPTEEAELLTVIEHPSKNQFIMISRLLKGFAIFATAMVAIYGIVVAPTMPGQKLLDAMPLLLTDIPTAIAMILVALHLDRKVGAMRQAWYANHRLSNWQGEDLVETDRRIREQIESALKQSLHHLEDTRGTLYRRGNEQSALNLGELNQSIGNFIKQIPNNGTGKPLYLSIEPQSSQQLESLLDYDETLLQHAATMAEVSAVFQTEANNGIESADTFITDLKNQLVKLEHNFSNRSQIIK